MIAAVLAVPMAAAGPLDGWPRCAVVYYTLDPLAYQVDPSCLSLPGGAPGTPLTAPRLP